MATENLSLIQNRRETLQFLFSLKKETRILLAGALFAGFPSKQEVKEFYKKHHREYSELHHCIHDEVCEGRHGKDYDVLSEINDFLWEIIDETNEENV